MIEIVVSRNIVGCKYLAGDILSLYVAERYLDFISRVKMANIAQIANVLQSMVLTKDDKMVLTPTYYVFKMYVPHQGARMIPVTAQFPEMKVRSERSDS